MGAVTRFPPPATRLAGRPWILQRYLFDAFMRNLGLALGGLTLLLVLGNLLDELPRLARYSPHLGDLAAYFALRVPWTMAQAIPLGVLVGVLFTLAGLLRSHELVGMRAGGMSQWDIAAPFLVPAVAISIMTIAFDEAIVPWANSRAAEIKRVNIKQMPVRDILFTQRAALWAPDGKLVYADTANGEDGVLTRVMIAEFTSGKLLGRVDAESARPEKGAWVLDHAQVYRWHRGDVELRRPRKAVYPMPVGMDDILQEERELKQQSVRELSATIRRLRMAGKDARSELVFYHLKWAFPFASLIVAMLALGISFTFQTNPREGMAASFGVAIASAIVYIGMVQVGQALGVGGALPPIIAMWLANIVFLVAGTVLLWRAWRW